MWPFRTLCVSVEQWHWHTALEPLWWLQPPTQGSTGSPCAHKTALFLGVFPLFRCGHQPNPAPALLHSGKRFLSVDGWVVGPGVTLAAAASRDLRAVGSRAADPRRDLPALQGLRHHQGCRRLEEGPRHRLPRPAAGGSGAAGRRTGLGGHIRTRCHRARRGKGAAHAHTGPRLPFTKEREQSACGR